MHTRVSADGSGPLAHSKASKLTAPSQRCTHIPYRDTQPGKLLSFYDVFDILFYYSFIFGVEDSTQGHSTLSDALGPFQEF